MDRPQIKSFYTARDIDHLSFHDCHVHGISWANHNYSLTLNLDYIAQWVETEGTYHFWVARAQLCFEFVSEPKITLDWTSSEMQFQIQELHKRRSRIAVDGSAEFHWEIELSSPYGSITLWSSDFKLSILAEPVLVNVPYLS